MKALSAFRFALLIVGVVAVLPLRADSLGATIQDALHPATTVQDTAHGLSFIMPKGWHLERKGTSQNPYRYVYDYGMPKIVSPTEHELVENTVAVTVFDIPCSSVTAIEALHQQRLGDNLIERKPLKTDASDQAQEEIVKLEGATYRRRVDYFLRKQTGYTVTFKATEGTYASNLPLYLEFLKTFKPTGRPN